jgi:hypothetical protein
MELNATGVLLNRLSKDTVATRLSIMYARRHQLPTRTTVGDLMLTQRTARRAART